MTLYGNPRKRKSHGRSTLADVAAHAAVSAMTVSRALRLPSSVSPAVLERIQQALEATGYTPNKSAGLLASGRSQIVAALIPNIANSIFAETIQGLSDVLQPRGLELLLAATNYSMSREEEQIRTLLGWAPRALVITGRVHSPGALSMLRRARDEGVPVIEIWDQSLRGAEFLQVGFNHRKAGAAMAAHLQQCAYDTLGFVQSNNALDTRALERCSGFVQAARKAGLAVQILHPPQGEAMQAGRLLVQQLSQERALPRALAFTNDLFATGAYLQAQAQGLLVPQELALLGFGDMPIAAQIGAGISTLAVPRYAIGQQTGECVLAQIALSGDATATQGDSPSLQPRLVTRGTTALPS